MPNTTVALRLEPAVKDLGEFTVRRALPNARHPHIGPFVFFDHMGPADFPPGSGINVRSHPHIGLATITYLFAGEILHRDSLGFVQPIRPGEVNWMTAGRGIVHSEKVRPELLETGQTLHGLQVWIGLPSEREEIEPRFEHYAATEIPEFAEGGATVRIIVGAAYGHESPVRTESTTLYIEARLDAGSELALPKAEELGIYVVDGEVSVNGEALRERELCVLADNAVGSIKAQSAAHVMFCGGDKLDGKRTVWWNFVSSSKERIERAKDDWNSGKFGKVPGETDFIPLPE